MQNHIFLLYFTWSPDFTLALSLSHRSCDVTMPIWKWQMTILYYFIPHWSDEVAMWNRYLIVALFCIVTLFRIGAVTKCSNILFFSFYLEGTLKKQSKMAGCKSVTENGGPITKIRIYHRFVEFITRILILPLKCHQHRNNYLYTGDKPSHFGYEIIISDRFGDGFRYFGDKCS